MAPALRTADPPILLPMAAYHGTLAAVRCLGAAGIRVTLVESRLLVPAVWSRYVWRRTRAPSPELQPERFIEWLLEFGARNERHVLYPTSDDVAFLYAAHRAELGRHFHLHHPSLESTWEVLNKTRLEHAARAVGLAVPRTWVPRDEATFERIAAEAIFPVVIKPQTQALLHPHLKGVVVATAAGLRPRHREFTAAARHDALVVAHDPSVGIAAVQEYALFASEDVYGISGFIDESGEQFVARASRKILQQPRELGVGLCFEEAEVVPELAAKVRALCLRAGHHGVFEAEFIQDRGGAHQLIDFNPRFYGQMAFDVARELPQPLLAYEHALGRPESVARLVAAARSRTGPRDVIYCRRFELELMVALRRLFGSMSREEAARWRGWLSQHEARLVDAVQAPHDRRPGVVEALHLLEGFVRHPRSFVRRLLWT